MEHESDADALHSLLFLHLIAMFQAAAMQHLGKILNPLTNTIERDLEQAKMSIDILDMLKAKTLGNLSKSEQDFLDKVVFELHMNYVDEAGKPGEPESEKEAGTEAEAGAESSAEPGMEADAAHRQDSPPVSQNAEDAAEKQPGQSKKSRTRKTKPKGENA